MFTSWATLSKVANQFGSKTEFMRTTLIIGAALIALTSPAFGQCWESSGTTTAARSCNAIAHAAQVAQPVVGIGFVGGNPIAGASSTLGMRLGKIPRITVAVRGTGVFMRIPDLDKNEINNGLGRFINVDAAVGVLSGWSLAPTIGGFGSLDAVVSVGKSGLGGDFPTSPASWAVGGRVGILRESFTAPGISVTAMYRAIGTTRYGAVPDVTVGSGTGMELSDNNVKSVRAVIGKRLFVIGANAGIGYDKFSSTASVYPALGGPTPHDVATSRKTVFANLTWTMLILNIVAEGGVMKGGDAFTSPLPSGRESRTDKSTYFASLAVRLAL